MSARAAERVAELRFGRIRRHILLCVDPTRPKCCSRERTLESWQFLKRRLDELGLASGPDGGPVARTRANCLRVCAEGPVAVVWPDGIWYAGMTPEALERVIREHLGNGLPVEDYRIPVPPEGSAAPGSAPGCGPGVRAAGAAEALPPVRR